MRDYRLICLTALAGILLGFCAARALASDIIVSGWPKPENPMSSTSFMGFTDDPLLGRLACPPLLRFNLEANRFDQLILRSAQATSARVWDLTLRNGIYWWSGEEVKSEHLKAYLEEFFAEVVQFKADKLWEIPKYEVATTGAYQVRVRWSEEPVFGPQVLAGVPFWRKGQSGNECGGLYKIAQDNFRSATLVPNPGYKRIKKNIAIDYVKAAKDADFVFQFAENYGGSPWVRFSDEDTDCRHTVALPTFSMLMWNEAQERTSKKELRQIFSMLVPRGALLSYGAGSLGQLVSAPIPKAHPGYDSALSALATDMPKAANELERLGYRRPHAEGPRLLPDGKPMRLRIKSDSPGTTLVEKIVADAFSAVGISMDFVHGYVSAGPFDGQLTAVTINPVTSDLMFLLHSKYGMLDREITLQKNQQLDKLLEQYSLSWTKKPDFDLLKKIHAILVQEMPMTVLVQHSACLTGNKSRFVKRINVNDPDWFKRIVR